jgi:hypothetical protein
LDRFLQGLNKAGRMRKSTIAKIALNTRIPASDIAKALVDNTIPVEYIVEFSEWYGRFPSTEEWKRIPQSRIMLNWIGVKAAVLSIPKDTTINYDLKVKTYKQRRLVEQFNDGWFNKIKFNGK